MNFRPSGTGIIREVIELKSVGSTNTRALEEGRTGLLVVADEQTGGRGRHGRPWFSPGGRNVYLTLTVGSTDARLSIVAGVAAHEAVSSLLGHGAAVEIKWPNDLLVRGRKLCGILCETRGGLAAVGIGLNVNGLSWPPELAGRATSLEEVLGSPLEVSLVTERLASSLEKWLALFMQEGFEPVRARFLLHGMLKGHDLATEQGEPCTVVGMEPDGRLIIDVSGSRRFLVSGTVLIKP
ncbi:MAG TPA: biotin--[acetyl-CoA-carboxylase] ligase [Deltaproteobacteria bacterium]|nr:biotin--[acetyl-CoA-carboxylase] ligase [Deltaproteobacteria bacterium]